LWVVRVGTGQDFIIVGHAITVGVFPDDLVNRAAGVVGEAREVKLARLVFAERRDVERCAQQQRRGPDAGNGLGEAVDLTATFIAIQICADQWRDRGAR